jgi:hypothetical protein
MPEAPPCLIGLLERVEPRGDAPPVERGVGLPGLAPYRPRHARQPPSFRHSESGIAQKSDETIERSRKRRQGEGAGFSPAIDEVHRQPRLQSEPVGGAEAG